RTLDAHHKIGVFATINGLNFGPFRRPLGTAAHQGFTPEAAPMITRPQSRAIAFVGMLGIAVAGCSSESGGAGATGGTGESTGVGAGRGGAGSSGRGGSGGSNPGTCTPSTPAGSNATGSGPHKVTVETNAGPGIGEGTIFRPTDLGGTEKYPIFVWGEGA